MFQAQSCLQPRERGGMSPPASKGREQAAGQSGCHTGDRLSPTSAPSDDPTSVHAPYSATSILDPTLNLT